jgi:hypothetical protein
MGCAHVCDDMLHNQGVGVVDNFKIENIVAPNQD